MASATADFERIYRRHARDVYRFALSVVRNPLEAEDVTQTTFLNAYRALERGDRPDRPCSWLLAIAHNAIRSRDRWRLRRPTEVPLDVAEYRLAARPDETPTVDELLHALGDLPDAQREALARRELQGQTYPEIAEVLGVSVSAVESLIARARRALRAQRDRLAGIAVLRRLCEQGDGGLPGVAAKAAVAVAAATALAGGMAVESRVAGPPRADAAPRAPAAAPRPAPASAPASAPVVPVVHPASRTDAPQAPPGTAATTVSSGDPPTTTPPAAGAAAAPAPATSPAATTQPLTAGATTAGAATVATAADAVVSAPAATLPAVTAPAATVPAVTTPVATTPSVTAPTVTTPAVTTPTVTLPALPPPPTVPLP
ncbi:MAG TPA: sigma-70 family RNA polymerase sigma factor [Gaiellaceae bacterium]|jgi:RNA polymerase sigma factor (sigma-70 family)